MSGNLGDVREENRAGISNCNLVELRSFCLGLHLEGNRRLREDLGRMMVDVQGLQNIYNIYRYSM